MNDDVWIKIGNDAFPLRKVRNVFKGKDDKGFTEVVVRWEGNFELRLKGKEAVTLWKYIESISKNIMEDANAK